MKMRRLLITLVALLSLSCNFLSQGIGSIVAPTAAPTPTPFISPSFIPTTVPVASSTDTPEPTGTPYPTPAYTPAECQGKPVATLPAATTVAEPTLGVGTNPPIAKDEQEKVFNDLVSVIQNVYLYPDYNGIDWPGTVAKYRAKIDGGLDTDTFYTAMEDFIAELKDNHSQFESPVVLAASNAELAGRNDYVGIGVVIKTMLDKGHLTVINIFPGSSAEHSGLKIHDSLLAVDGIPLVENGKAYPQRVRGPECSELRLTVQSPGEQPRDVYMLRYKIDSSEPILARLVPTQDGSKIGYIFIPTFFDETIPSQVMNALKTFGNLDGLILDNRMNGGGSSDVVEPILSYFTSGTVGHFVSRTSQRPLTIQANPVQNSQTVPLVVLVGEDTVSFGEIFSGIMQDESRAKIVGHTTAGNVEILHAYSLDDGSRVWIAQERFDPAHSHTNYEKVGVIPDVVASADWDTFTFETDPGIAAAMKLLGH